MNIIDNDTLLSSPLFDISLLEAEIFKDLTERDYDVGSSAVITVAVTIVYSGLAVAGLLANVLFCCIIWRSEKLHTVTHMLMTNLAASNILFIVFHPSYFITTYILQKDWIFGTVVCKTSFSIAYVTSTASFYFMCLVAIDRWLAIFHRKWRLDRQKCIYLSLSAWFISVCVAAPYLYRSKVYDLGLIVDGSVGRWDGRNISKQISVETHLFRCGSDNASNVLLILTIFFQYCIPLAVMVPTYSHLALFVWRRAPIGIQSKEKTKKAYRRRRKLLCTLLAIVIFLVICWFPLFSLNVMFSQEMISHVQYTQLYIYFSMITLLGVLITPICYLVNDGCRQQVVAIMACLRPKKPQRERQTLMTTMGGQLHTPRESVTTTHDVTTTIN